MAWAFTRLSGDGVWRYQVNVSEVIAHVFLFVYILTNSNNNLNNNDYEETDFTISCFDNDANGGKCS